MDLRFPSKYSDPKVLLERIEEYFNVTDPKLQTRAGLCVFLGISKPTYYKYQNDELFHEAIEWANTRIENKYELDLNLRPNPTGPIFALKQYGWADKNETEVKGSGSFEIITNIPRPKED